MVQTFSNSILIGDIFRSYKFRCSCGRLFLLWLLFCIKYLIYISFLCNVLFVVKWKSKHKHTVDTWRIVANILHNVKLTRVKTSYDNEYLKCFIATHFSLFQYLIENLTSFIWLSSSSLSVSITTSTSIERK